MSFFFLSRTYTLSNCSAMVNLGDVTKPTAEEYVLWANARSPLEQKEVCGSSVKLTDDAKNARLPQGQPPITCPSRDPERALTSPGGRFPYSSWHSSAPHTKRCHHPPQNDRLSFCVAVYLHINRAPFLFPMFLLSLPRYRTNGTCYSDHCTIVYAKMRLA